jgi:eukaryotic translation initiation factor 2-alpha kinase 4
LKPENIFISSPSADAAVNVKIGDFGLATSGQFAVEKTPANNQLDPSDVTRSIGTPFYAAPEVRSEVQGSYSTKVDVRLIKVFWPNSLGGSKLMRIDVLSWYHLL